MIALDVDAVADIIKPIFYHEERTQSFIFFFVSFMFFVVISIQ